MTSWLVIFRAFLFIFFSSPPTLNLKKNPHKSTNKKILAWTWNMQYFNIQESLCSGPGQFEQNLVVNAEDRFHQDKVQLISI